MSQTDVIIVGAGIAGLACATELRRAGVSFNVLEAADAAGGRMRTDRYEGFLLDRGFQVLLSAYPECRRTLDYKSLDLQPFLAGSIIHWNGKLHQISDPWQEPGTIFETLLAPIGSLGDKLRIAKLRGRLKRTDLRTIFSTEPRSTLVYLREHGFSAQMIERFFRPFLGGVFLDRELETSSQMFEFVFKMFSEGEAVVPQHGMQAIPDQLAGALPDGSIRYGCSVTELSGSRCTLDSGETLSAEHVVLATDGNAASKLLSDARPPRWKGTLCLYFDAPEPPIPSPVLVLNGEGSGPVNSVSVMSEVSPSYAPEGRSLVGLSIVGSDGADETLEQAALAQMQGWFGTQVKEWRPLRHYAIPYSLPAGGPFAPAAVSNEAPQGVHVCGDHVENASIHGAMRSGRKVAEAILQRR